MLFLAFNLISSSLNVLIEIGNLKFNFYIILVIIVLQIISKIYRYLNYLIFDKNYIFLNN